MDQAPPDQLATALSGLRAAATGPDWAAALLRFAVDLTNAETGIILRGEEIAARLPAEASFATPPAWVEAAAAALTAGAVRYAEEGPGLRTAFAVPAAGSCMVVALHIASPLHAAFTRERLQLVSGFAAAVESGARSALPAILGTVLPIALAAPDQAMALHRAAGSLADLLRARRVAIGIVAGQRVRSFGVSDHPEVARGSELARQLLTTLETALDGDAPEPDTAGSGPRRIAAAAGPIALAIESEGALPARPLALKLAEGLAPLAIGKRQVRTGLGLRHVALVAAVATGLAAVLPTTDEIDAPFVLAPIEQRMVTTPFDALLDEILVEPGDRVRAGETVLARLSTREMRLELSAAEARAANDRREADIARARSNPAGEQLALLSAERAAAQVALLTQRIEMAVIRAPIDGVVVSGDLRRNVGQMAARGQLLFEVAPPDRLRAEVLVLDADAPRLQDGARLRLSPAADPGRHIAATVERVRPATELVQGRNVVRAIATLGDGTDITGLRAGTEGRARIEAGRTTWLFWAIGDVIRSVRSRLWI